MTTQCILKVACFELAGAIDDHFHTDTVRDRRHIEMKAHDEQLQMAVTNLQ